MQGCGFLYTSKFVLFFALVIYFFVTYCWLAKESAYSICMTVFVGTFARQSDRINFCTTARKHNSMTDRPTMRQCELLHDSITMWQYELSHESATAQIFFRSTSCSFYTTHYSYALLVSVFSALRMTLSSGWRHWRMKWWNYRVRLLISTQYK